MAAFKYSFEILLHLQCETCNRWFTLSVDNRRIKTYTCPNCKAELTDGSKMPIIISVLK